MPGDNPNTLPVVSTWKIRTEDIEQLKETIAKARGQRIGSLLVAEIAHQWNDRAEQTWQDFVDQKTKLLDAIYGKPGDKRRNRLATRDVSGFTEQDIADFRYIWKDQFGKEISVEEAGKFATDIKEFVKLAFNLDKDFS
jgi:hypothetical protein